MPNVRPHFALNTRSVGGRLAARGAVEGDGIEGIRASESESRMHVWQVRGMARWRGSRVVSRRVSGTGARKSKGDRVGTRGLEGRREPLRAISW